MGYLFNLTTRYDSRSITAGTYAITYLMTHNYSLSLIGRKMIRLILKAKSVLQSHSTLQCKLAMSSYSPKGSPLLPPLMRSCFFTKKTRQGLECVKKYRPDSVILDLEDSVQSHEKPSIRKLYLNGIKDGLFSGVSVYVRSSSIDCTSEFIEDIKTFTGTGITGFLLPKVENRESVLEAEKILLQYEDERGLDKNSHTFAILIETPAAYFEVQNILLSSKRISSVICGSADFTAEALCDDHSPTYDAFFTQVALAAKATKKVAVWGVHDKLDDYIGFESNCFKMKRCGYDGVLALTPKQILLANQVYSLSHNEKDWTERVLKKSTRINTIRKSVQESRQMIGPPHKLKASNILASRVEMEAILSKSIQGHAASSKGICTDLAIGEIVPAPHEVFITDSWKTAWESSFITSRSCYDKNNDACIPFALAATLAVAFSVSNLSYYARVHLGFKNIFQHRPLLTGDRVRAMFRIDSVKSKKGSDSIQYSVVHSTHWLVNQNDEIVLQLEKITMFQPEDCSLKLATDTKTRTFAPLDSILRKSILEQPSNTLLPRSSQKKLIPGQLLIHDLVKVMGHSETRMLCTLLHIVNPHHHSIVRYQHTDLLIPGPFVMSAGMSLADQDIGEIIYEDIPVCINPNKVNFGDQLGVMTFIVDRKDVNGVPEYEEITLKHFVLKNTNIELLAEINVPIELFENGHMKPSEYEHLCASECPVLLHKIACVTTRKIIRVRPDIYSCRKVPSELIMTD